MADLGGRLHDCAFQLDRLRWDRVRRCVTLPLGCPRPFGQQGAVRYRLSDLAAKPSLLLEIRHVQDVVVEDPEKVGFYDINEMQIATDGTVVIESSIPCWIHVAVDRIAMYLWDISTDESS